MGVFTETLKEYGLGSGEKFKVQEGKNVIRYESPEVFETLTKEWVITKSGRKSKAKQAVAAESMEIVRS